MPAAPQSNARVAYSFFGPVWPPEAICHVSLPYGQVEIVFRDEWVSYESGGESLWRGRYRRGLWTLQRIRELDYGGDDEPAPPRPGVLPLPADYREPDPVFLQRIAERLASHLSVRIPAWVDWLLPIPLLVGCFLGRR